MKIKKLNESILTEAEEDVTVIKDADSGEEVLDKVEKEAEDADIKVNSVEVAGEIAGAADKINAENTVVDLNQDTSIGVENFITKALDDCLETAYEWKEEGIKEVANIMICGLPGSGKTASVYDWASRAKINGKKVHITYLNMKNNDLDAFINGYTVQDKNDQDYVKQAYSRNLDGLEQENSILFLDEYNRQTESQIRASVLTLINEHYIVGKDNGGKHYFKNFLFTIAVMNPSLRSDRGAAELNDAEKSRFLYYFDNVDSDPETTVEYLNKFYDGKIKAELAKAEPDYNKIEKYLRIKDLGIYICEHSAFEYDGKDVLSDLAIKQKKMLNQRALTAGLAASRGDAQKFINWLLRGANFLDKAAMGHDSTTEMLLQILDSYMAPSREELFADAKIKEPKEEAPEEEKAQENPEQTAPEAAEDEVDDSEGEEADNDPDFWANAGGAASSNVQSPSDVETIANNIMNSWGNF